MKHDTTYRSRTISDHSRQRSIRSDTSSLPGITLPSAETNLPSTLVSFISRICAWSFWTSDVENWITYQLDRKDGLDVANRLTFAFVFASDMDLRIEMSFS